jgi:hypothetical protein
MFVWIDCCPFSMHRNAVGELYTRLSQTPPGLAIFDCNHDRKQLECGSYSRCVLAELQDLCRPGFRRNVPTSAKHSSEQQLLVLVGNENLRLFPQQPGNHAAHVLQPIALLSGNVLLILAVLGAKPT